MIRTGFVKSTMGCALVASCLVAGCAFCGCKKKADTGERVGSSAPPAPVATIEDITPQQARDLLAKSEAHIYLDVRSTWEFADGHVPDSWNIPLLHIDRDAGTKTQNDDFIAVVKTNIPETTPVIVGCKSGGRSAMAARSMQAAGYRTLYNVVGGFVGRNGPDGTMAKPGWSKLGYPVEKGDGGKHGYQSLSTAGKD